MIKIFNRNLFLKSLKPSATLALLCLFFIVNNSFAQNINAVPKQAPQNQQKASDIEIREKINELENSGGDPVEIQKQTLDMLKAAGIKIDITLSELDFAFQPKYIPMNQFENWKNIATAYNPNVTKFIVVVNAAYFLDYNNYSDRAINKKIADLGYLNPVDENMALEFFFPDLTLLSSKLPEGTSLVQNLKLFFAANPQLYAMTPVDLIVKTRTDTGIQSLIKMQKSNKKN